MSAEPTSWHIPVLDAVGRNRLLRVTAGDGEVVLMAPPGCCARIPLAGVEELRQAATEARAAAISSER